ncbi:hypothetical protein J1N35_012832 [Gossypium stocksii]|uniref:Uncharacterized protein n=1 Tax=Gossypium stocksii TaxID=47602 RepID=A0A9D3VTC4_9ROSI|nr:hypothetical protein J1N35_012832 [Gossypium stocksii]
MPQKCFKISKTVPFCFFGSQSAAKLDSSTKRCWNRVACKTGTTPFLYSDSCRSIQPVALSIDYFQIFGLENKYEIEVDVLEGEVQGLAEEIAS